MHHPASSSGFTFIELSIVLVIIGLIVGGILVGRDLISAAEVRSQISQIEKYNSAVNTFRAKFNAIPGDMPPSIANQFGFSTGASCSGTLARRDGDGLLHGWASFFLDQTFGETGLFWVDISSPVAGSLIDGRFPNSGADAVDCATWAYGLTLVPGTTYIGDYLPVGKIGHGTFLYVYENNGYNWYGLSAVTSTFSTGSGRLFSNPTIPVIQSYNIDKKIDDGLPTTGVVVAAYINDHVSVQQANAQTTDTTTSCYNTSSNVYSIGSAANYGNGGNCALSFRFQ